MRRSTALTFQMIKTSNRAAALRALGLGTLGAGVLGGGALAYNQLGGPSSLSDLGFYYENPKSLPPSPIMLNAADPFQTMNNIQDRVREAHKIGNLGEQISRRAAMERALGGAPTYSVDPKDPKRDDFSTYGKIRFREGLPPAADISFWDETLMPELAGASRRRNALLGLGVRGTPELGYEVGRDPRIPLAAFE